MSILSKGEKVHVLIRREYEVDIRLRFVGEVVETTDTVVRLRGYAFVFDTGIGKFVRSAEQMERIISLVDSVTPDVDSGHETFFHAATCLA